MNKYSNNFIDSSIKFRNISLSQNEKEMVSNTAPVTKMIVIDYFIEAIKNLNLKNPIIVAGDAPTYSTFSYTATEGDKVSPKYTRGVSVISTDWSVQLKTLGDVLDSAVYDYGNVRRGTNEPPRVLERNTYGWVEQTNLEVTFWSINSSKGRDLGGQFIKRTMLEAQKNLYFIKNGIMSCIPSSGFDSNDTALLKTNGSILYQHVTRWTLSSFFFINTTIYEPSATIDGLILTPGQINELGDVIEEVNISPGMFTPGSSANTVEFLESGAAVIYNTQFSPIIRNQDENLNAYATVTLSDRNQPNTSLITTTTVVGQTPYVAQNYSTLNNYYLSDEGFNSLLERDFQNNVEGNFILNEAPGASNIETTMAPITVTTTTTTTTTTTSSTTTTTTV